MLCFNQVFDLLLLCTKCIPRAVALLLHTGVENECRMAEGVSVLLTQHQRVVVERQDQGGVVVDPAECLLARADLPAFWVCGIHPGGEGIQKGEKRLAEICVKRAVQVHVLCVLDRRTASRKRTVYDIFSCACGAGGGRIPLTCLRHNEELRLGLDAATQQGAWGSDRGQRYMGAILDREACQGQPRLLGSCAASQG